MKCLCLYLLIPKLILLIDPTAVSSTFVVSSHSSHVFHGSKQHGTTSLSLRQSNKNYESNEEVVHDDLCITTNLFHRKQFLIKSILTTASLATSTTTTLFTNIQPSYAKCTDIESCREIGERKVEQDMIDNPTIRLDSGVRYKVLQPGTNANTNDPLLNKVQPNSNIDLIFSVSTLSGGYMYSRGFGFEKIDIGDGKLQNDLGLDSLRVQLGNRDVPIGIEDALIGMKKGERRRVELPPRVGFETSNWRPEPTTRRGITRIAGYKQLLEGNGSTRPAFPAATIWDVEVLKIRKQQ